MPQHWCGDPFPEGSPRSVGEATKNYARGVSFPGAISISLHQRFHAQHRVTLFGQPVQQLLAVGSNGLVGNHVGEVVDAVQLLGRLVQALGNVVLQLLGHPDNALDAALSSDELLGGDEVTAVTHVAGGLDATRIIREVSPKIPVIAVSAYAYEKDKAAAIESGCNEFLTKPISPDLLKDTINKYLKNT